MFLKKLLSILFNQAGQIPSTETVNYDAVLSTTLRSYRRKLADNITKGNQFLAWLRSKGRFSKQSGGYNVHIPLMHAQNSTADIYSGYGLLDTTPQDGITTAFFDWSQLSTSITISNLEKKQNKGEAKILDLLKAKTMQAEVSLQQLLNNCLVAGRITTTTGSGNDQVLRRIGRLDSGALAPYPLGALIDADPTRSVSIGNINGNTYSFWRNQSVNSAATTFIGLRSEMNNAFNRCAKGPGGSPDLLLGDQIIWETYWLSMSQNERYLVEDKRTLDVLGGSDVLKFRGAALIWDEVVPDLDTPYNPVDATGTAGFAHGGSNTAGNSTLFYINSQAMEYVVESDTDFDTTDFVRPENQDAVTAQILWMGAVCVNNRRKLGVLWDVPQNIAA